MPSPFDRFTASFPPRGHHVRRTRRRPVERERLKHRHVDRILKSAKPGDVDRVGSTLLWPDISVPIPCSLKNFP
jgi:hypothetical protein